MLTQSKALTTRLLALAIGATAIGCAADLDGAVEDTNVDESEALPALVAPIDQQASKPNPNVPYIVSVKANGTGCPAGTWNTDVSADGETFTTSFNAYVAEVNEKQSLAVRDCLLSVQLKSPSGISYAITDFQYYGYVVLDQGLTAFQSANYYFQGMPVPAEKEKRTDLTGPVDRVFSFVDKVTTADAVWSPCGKDRLLQVPTRLQVRRTSGKGIGYINVMTIGGKTEGKIIFKLTHKTCKA